MFGKRITLFRLFGFEVRIDLSWLVLAVLITWSLAQGLFPSYFEGFSRATYWWMGAAGALGLFVSIVFHELCHSLVARRYGLPIKGITLFIFGGVAEMEDQPASAKVEFLMAIAGPISSIVLALWFYLLVLGGRQAGWPEPFNAVLLYLVWLNFLLAGFNLIPAFPLDGGRVLRSILWRVKNNLRWATHVASQLGSGFGVLLIVMGIFNILVGNFMGGIWWFLIGMFLRSASQMSYQQLLMRRALEGEAVRRFMQADPISVPPSISVQDLVENYFYKYHFKMFPVVQDGRLIGYVTTRDVKELPREEWSRRTVADVVKQPCQENVIGPEVDAMKALSTMSRTRNSRLMVVDGDRLIGIIALKDMLRFLSLKFDLEGDEE